MLSLGARGGVGSNDGMGNSNDRMELISLHFSVIAGGQRGSAGEWEDWEVQRPIMVEWKSITMLSKW